MNSTVSVLAKVTFFWVGFFHCLRLLIVGKVWILLLRINFIVSFLWLCRYPFHAGFSCCWCKNLSDLPCFMRVWRCSWREDIEAKLTLALTDLIWLACLPAYFVQTATGNAGILPSTMSLFMAQLCTSCALTAVLPFLVHSDSLRIALSSAAFTTLSPFSLICLWFRQCTVSYSVDMIWIPTCLPFYEIWNMKYIRLVQHLGTSDHFLGYRWVRASSFPPLVTFK